MSGWSTALPFFLLAVLVAFEEWASSPSCETLDAAAAGPEDLKVVMVADLLLLDPDDAGPAHLYFRDPYTARFLKKSFQKLKPDMLVVLGDISANGSYLTNSKWLRLLKQFQKMLGPFTGYPLHIVLGDRDVGNCEEMDLEFISWISKNLPGLDSSGCGVFEIANISFVSLNSVAMLCGNSEARYNVETAIERESFDLWGQTRDRSKDFKNSYEASSTLSEFLWRDNIASSGSGPVLLLHFPLNMNAGGECRKMQGIGHSFGAEETLWKLNSDSRVDPGPYELTQSLHANTTEYILQALQPRMVFSAHSHDFLDRTHGDGTREITVPAMSWAARNDPGFVVVAFGQNKSVIVSRCYLARESRMLMVYSCILIVFITSTLVLSRWCFG